MPQNLLDQFTAETGVKVNYVRHRLGRDPQQAAGREPGAELHRRRRRVRLVVHRPVRRGASGWSRSTGSARPTTLDDLKRTDAAFISGGKTYAACYSNDFRVSMYNTKMFAEGGDHRVPGDLRRAAARPSRSSRRRASSTRCRSRWRATEGGVTPWYLLTLAMGGQLFDDQLQADVLRPRARPATRRSSGRPTRSRTAGCRPAPCRWTTRSPSTSSRPARRAIVLATGPGNMADRERPRASRTSPATPALGLVPGVDGPGASFGLPEGLSIPVTAKHKAAAAAFIEWWERPENAIAIYKTQGSLPCGASAIKQLADSGELQGGDVLNAELPHVVAAVPGRRADLVLAVQLRRPGPAERGGQGRHERGRRAQPARVEGRIAQPVRCASGAAAGAATGPPARPRSWGGSWSRRRSLARRRARRSIRWCTGSSRASGRAASCSASSRATSGLRNYRDVLNDPTSRDAMRHTVEYVAAGGRRWRWCWASSSPSRCTASSAAAGSCWPMLILPWALPSVVSRRALAARVRSRQRPPEQRCCCSLHVISRAARLAGERAGRDRLHHARPRVGRAAAGQPDLPGRAAEHPRRGVQRLGRRRRRPVAPVPVHHAAAAAAVDGDRADASARCSRSRSSTRSTC